MLTDYLARHHVFLILLRSAHFSFSALYADMFTFIAYWQLMFNFQFQERFFSATFGESLRFVFAVVFRQHLCLLDINSLFARSVISVVTMKMYLCHKENMRRLIKTDASVQWMWKITNSIPQAFKVYFFDNAVFLVTIPYSKRKWHRS